MSIPLFEHYPALEKRLPWIPLGSWPTPVHQLEMLGKTINYPNIWVKRDDLTSKIYGGNKIRKLEFLLADALKKGCRWVVTYGGIGTNHGLATVIHGKTHGLRTALVLVKQPLTDHVQENLLLDCYYGAEMHYAPTMLAGFLQTAGVYLRHGRVYFIPPGGSSTTGSIGFINAAFEMKQQVDAGLLPEPEYIFCALGSKGTMAGLLAGTRLAGMKSKVIGIRVTEQWLSKPHKVARLANDTISMLHKQDSSVPLIKFSLQDINVTHDFFGGGYGRETPEGRSARSLLMDTENIRLELTYTAKTFAAMLDYINKNPGLKNAPLLYWHTYSAVDFTDILLKADQTRLPDSLQWCFKDNLIHPAWEARTTAPQPNREENSRTAS
ncbi:MAG: pyridoxal-phosphate dependent enzyme [Dehalococcoidia bacterium]|nr:pyridoxal-phosphate dependent enzyme [Dehalococcoidia bacterium]